MSKFKNWYIRNQDAITWFLVGFLTFGMLHSLVAGEYGSAAFSAALIVLNVGAIKIRID
jgi:hypothetical protein